MSKKTISAIVNDGNDYLIVVKRNQKTLHRQIESHIHNTSSVRHFEQTEKTRNRVIRRTVEVFSAPSNLDSRWIGVESVIKIFRSGTRGDHDYQSPTPTYYISSLPPTSSLIPRGIRQHWGIENRLHWIKDVIYQEDTSPVLEGKARTPKGFWSTPLTLGLSPRTNISLIKSWVINLLRIHGYNSMTEALSHLSHNLPLLLSFCR